MKHHTTITVGVLCLTAAVAAPRSASAQSAWEVAAMCDRMNNDPALRPMLNERVRENPPIIATASGGFTMINTRGGGFGGERGDGIGLGGNAHVEAELGVPRPFWARAAVQFVGAGRFGFMGDVSVGVTGRSYGARFIPAGAQVTVSRYSVSYQSWNNHCSLQRFDIHAFTGIRWGAFMGRDIRDSSDNLVRSVPAEGWFAPQVGFGTRWRYMNGRSLDTTIAGMVDVTHGSWGLYLRQYSSFGPVYLGADFGFFMPFNGTATATHQPWDAFWLSANLGVHFEL